MGVYLYNIFLSFGLFFIFLSVAVGSAMLEQKWNCERNNNVNKCYMHYSITP